MIKIKIYCLEDQEENNIVTILGEGEHPIGRGDTLKCNDKKVSRNHAVIVVNETEVVLKSAHINPSFYRAANGKTIQLLKKDDSVPLNDGDCFALLADQFWFRIKIELYGNSSPDSPTEHQSLKRSIDAQINDEYSKRFKNALYGETVIKTSKIEGLDSFLNTIVPGNATVKNIDTDSLLNNLANITKEDYGDANVTRDDSSGIDKDNASAVSSTESIEETKNVMSAEEKLIMSTNNLNSSICGYQPSEQDQKMNPPTFDEECDNLTENQLVDESIILNSREKEPVVQAKNDISDDSEESMDLATENELKRDFWGLTKPDNIKQSKGRVDEPEGSNVGENPSSSNISSSSMDTQPKTRRDKCWYAGTCYRKNPSHRAQFSHPDDDDFDNDDEGDKPQCQFGAACYRKNAEHRKKFRHSIQPMTKPGDDQMQKKAKNNANDSKSEEELGRSYSAQDSRHVKRSKAVKKVKTYQETPEDDYDMEDPFINDGSSDDFQPSSESADDDTDWEDSQKVDEDTEETKRLLKEAKKFTEVKKKK